MLFLGLSAVPALTHAQSGGIQFQLKDYTGMANPNGAEQFLLAVLNIFIVIATPIIVLFIIYAGFLYVTAQGNAQQVQQATRALTYSIIGAVLILGAVAIAGIISGTVGAFRT